MKSFNTTWEDEDNNRQIHFSVQYELENETVEIKNVTPEKVSIICPTTKTCEKTIRVCTDKGRILLSSKLFGQRLHQLKDHIAKKETANISEELICIS